MFERYTEKARRVIFFARYEASQFGAPAIEPHHLLLGLLREDKTLTARFLTRPQASIDQIRKDLEGRGPLREKIPSSVELPLAVETKRVLQYAHEESDRLQHRHIGTEHLLLGLLREERSLAAELLYERGVRLGAVRDEIARARSGFGIDAQSDSVADSQESGEPQTFSERVAKLVAERIEPHLQQLRPKQHPERSTIRSEQSALRSEQSALRSGRRTVLGVEKLLAERLDLLRGARVGLVCNQASVDHTLQHVADLFRATYGINLTTLFGPQHGIRGDVQDNMIETPHTVDSVTGIPVHSLYSETREPTEEMLRETDVLVFDMQDVGCRIYTFIYTLANCMRAAKRYGKKVVVCDRPNPINGDAVAGNMLEPEYASFVGQFPLPTRHGMTVGELGRMFNEDFGIGCELEVVGMEGWSREQWFDDTDVPWVMPSPNIPSLDSATVFPGTVHLEGTQVSEGRGTTRPFELIGAPYVEAYKLAQRLSALGFPGVFFRSCGFQPTFQKHAGQTCGGVQIHVTDRRQFEPVIIGIAMVKTIYEMYGEQFRWKEPPYEYVFDKNPFDVIAGTRSLRDRVERGDSLESIEASWRNGIGQFTLARAKHLLY